MVLVVGATGSLGGRIARSLLAAGTPVRALVRPATPAVSLEQAGAVVVRGDLRDPESLERACAGMRAIVTTASATRRGDDSVDNVDLRGNAALFAAARNQGVEHVVMVSTAGAAPDAPVPAFRAKGRAEAALRASGVRYTILQPAPFMDVWFGMLVELPLSMGQSVTLVGESRGRHSFIAERDVAAFALAALENPAARDAVLVLGGPRAVTFREVVDAYQQALAREIPTRSVTPGAPIPGLPEPVWGIAAALEAGDNIVPMEATARRFGVTLTSVDDFARGRVAELAPLPSTPTA